MSRSAVHRADRQGSQSVTEAVATDPDARCFPRNALSAARTPKYPLNLAVIGRFTVAIATVKSDRVRVGKLGVDLKDIHGLGILGPCMSLECVGGLCRCKLRYVKVSLRNLCCVAFKE